MKKLLFGISTLMVFVLLFSSCTEDPPTADFLYTVDGLTVTFEDASELAADYEWDFGDGATSTEVNPIHTYAAEGTYTVKLTVTNEGGEDSRSESITVNKPSITIDGDFSDWDLYDVYYTGPSGTLKETRVTAANGFLFFYVKASAADAGPVIQVFFDKDNDGATGWDFWGAYETPGLEYLLEVALEAFEGQYGPTEAGSALFEATAEDWPWTITVAETDAVTESSGWITDGDDKILEFSVAQSLMPDLGTTVRMVFMNADNDWEEAGTLPAAWQDPPLPLDPIDL